MIRVEPNTIVVFSDIGCPWAHAAVHQLHEARSRNGLDGRVSFDHRAFPLELINGRPTPKHVLDAEVPVIAKHVPGAGWSRWDAPDYYYPVTTLPAMEAVQAAKEQDLGLSDRLDRALRRAWFEDSRCVSLFTEILDAARSIDGLDVAALSEALVEGRFRRWIFADLDAARSDEVKGSPHLFLPDGSDAHNPGMDMSWEEGDERPIVHSYDPGVYDDLVISAAR
jgi:predicted DsbA family dithiol-disulfide isomerase